MVQQPALGNLCSPCIHTHTFAGCCVNGNSHISEPCPQLTHSHVVITIRREAMFLIRAQVSVNTELTHARLQLLVCVCEEGVFLSATNYLCPGMRLRWSYFHLLQEASVWKWALWAPRVYGLGTGHRLLRHDSIPGLTQKVSGGRGSVASLTFLL